MSKKILDLNCNILVLCGIFLALHLIYTKEINIEINGYTINKLVSLIDTIVLVGFYRQMDNQISLKTKSHS